MVNPGMRTELSQNQQVTLTPKMVEELKILQMSSIELADYIALQLNENPLLEMDEDATAGNDTDNENETENYMANDMDNMDNIDNMDNYSDTVNYKDNSKGSLEDSGEPGEAEFGIVTRDKYYCPLENTAKIDFTEYTSKPVSLRQFLRAQVGELDMDESFKKAVLYLVENINEDGYLATALNSASKDSGFSTAELTRALRVIQSFDPAGVGARNLRECILLQLYRKDLYDEIVKSIVTNYLELLAKRKYNEISAKTGLPRESIIEIHNMIKSTDPNPGRCCSDEAGPQCIQPDLMVKELNGTFQVIFNYESTPGLRINDYYKNLMGNCQHYCENKPQSDRYIRGRLSKAIEIIRAVEQRNRTILNVAAYIIDYQKEFLKKGHLYLKPLTMKMAGDAVGLHESTISRAVNEKYIQTPKGVFELKYFFSSQITVENQNSAAASSNAVKKAIKDIIQKEDKSKPFSDEQIRSMLQEKGFKVARRTVAKYREMLQILPANLRRY